MKKIIALYMLFILSATTFSQLNRNYSNFSYQDYQLKSKRQKNAAWILLGGGLGLTIGGGVITANQFTEALVTALVDGKSTIEPSGAIMLLAGSVAILTSIPLFANARQNKKRSMSASGSFKIEKIEIVQKYNWVHTSYPAFSVKINL